MVGHDGHRGWYYYMGVSPDKQMGGLGRRIMSVAENWLQERGVGKAQLLLRSGNAKVKDFYARLGYSEEDRIVMAKRFRAVPDWQTGRTETMVLHLEMMARPNRSPHSRRRSESASRWSHWPFPACGSIAFCMMGLALTGPGLTGGSWMMIR